MPEPLRTERRYKGLPLSGGLAAARVCLFNEKRHSNLPMYKVEGAGVEREKGRLVRAFEIVGERLEGIRRDVADRIGKAEAEIFVAQKMIMEDEALRSKMFSMIEQQARNAEMAVMVVLDEYEARLLQVDNEYLQERASDLGEIKRRLLDVLANMNPSFQCAGEHHCQMGRNRVVVAEELTPSLAVDLDTEETLGFVTERGGRNSHAAILARALGIPAVSGISGIHHEISCGTEVLLNGDTGEVVVWPTEQTLEEVRPALIASRVAGEIPQPVDGFAVMANISGASDLEHVHAMQAEGVGLYRTEFEFMAAGERLDEAAQAERYIQVVQAMQGRPVTFRMLDMGGDKSMPFLNIPSEENPALGWRGSRLLQANPDMLLDQARAITRASEHGPVKVLFPMIVDLEQYETLRNGFLKAAEDLPHGDIAFGVMFEVPAACLQADTIFEHVDFASIGTNDLIQYLFAVDRDNDKVAYDYHPDRPVFWSLIKRLVSLADARQCPLSICGELAGDPQYIPKLMELGVQNVSVSPRLIPGVRRAVSAAMAASNA